MRKQSLFLLAASAIGTAGITTLGALSGAAGGATIVPSPAAWAALRNCESGGDYAINTGNGFYGAYQFNLQTWWGLGYSGLPSSAPPSVQDQAALRLWEQRGAEPWPVCGAYLTKFVQAGAPAPAPAPTPPPARAVVERAAAPVRPVTRARIPAGKRVHYTVRSGDTLSAIAQRFHSSVGLLASWNGISNPNLIYVGQVLTVAVVPEHHATTREHRATLEADHVKTRASSHRAVSHGPRTTATRYVVRPGDDLWSIALHFHSTAGRLASMNRLTNPNLIFPGQRLSV